jgi:hypothetical protein
MKNRYLIFSVLFWMVASVTMAVTLPTSSFSGGYNGGTESYETLLGTGVRMNNSMLRATNQEYANACTIEGVQQDPTYCTRCCTEKVLSESTDFVAFDKCVDNCVNGQSLGEETTPLGEALILLPFAFAYAVIKRKRKEIAE